MRPVVALSGIALAAVAGWLVYGLVRADSPADTTPVGEALPAPAGDARAASTAVPSARERPALEAPTEPGFADEIVDPAWADSQVETVTRQIAVALSQAQLTSVARAGAVECRSTRCQLVLEVREPERMGDALAALLDDERLRADAQQMKLSDLTPTSVTVTLTYEVRIESDSPLED